jgi:acetyl/propionyl-CoA carboxylase alpha subunit/acetyl-CoA carboxylase carboxyltransferase component
MTEFSFRRIAVVNRGEAAARVIRAVAELRRERGADLTSIALHTEAERSAFFVRQADEAHQLRPTAGNPYLDYDALAAALKETEADAVWVGWGFVAEHAEFADLCQAMGITFIGPSGDMIRTLGDKIGAKLLAEKVGVPVAAWSNGPVDTLDEAKAHGAEIGYPLLIKATAGGGGRGIRRVTSEDELAEAFERARQEGEKSFGDPTVFMEKLVTSARHVEVQVAADGHGGAWALGVRDCSIQRRDQKILEESSSPVLTAEQNAMLGRVAADLVVAAGYRNVGTVEFLYAPADETFAFLEVNTRLQVEHPITELTTGVDLVKLQLELASGRRLEGDPPPVFGHAIEARLNAEDPAAGFAPVTGRITTLRFPTGPGLRIDTGVAAGDRIQPDYDAMVAKVMAWGRDRDEARARLINGLAETVVVTEGGSANTSFLLDLLQRPEVIDGSADTGWVDRLVVDGRHISDDHADVALLVAAVEAYMAAAVYARSSFFAAAGRGRPQATHEATSVVDCRLRGEQYRLEVGRISPETFRVDVDGQSVTVSVRSIDDIESRVGIDGRTHRVRSFTAGRNHIIEVDGVSHTVSRDDAGTVRSPSPSLVIAVAVQPGQRVAKGDALVVLEAMKMETVVSAPFEGTVTEVMTRPSVQVDAGAALLTIEADETDTADSSGSRVTFGSLGSPRRNRSGGSEALLDLLQAIRWTTLGYDRPGGTGTGGQADGTSDDGGPSARLAALLTETDRHDPAVIDAGLAVVAAFSDISALGRNRRVDDPGDDESHNPTEYFHRYLRSLDLDAEGLPESFGHRLRRAFAHYGVTDLEPNLALQRAAFRVFHAQQSSAAHEALVAAVLDGLRLDLSRLGADQADRLRSTLEEFITSTELRFPNLGTLARSIRYEVFDQPKVASGRQRTLDDMAVRLQAIRSTGSTDGDDAEALKRCSEVVATLLARPGPDGTGDWPDPLLSVMFGRLYRAVDLGPITAVTDGPVDLCSAGYQFDGRPIKAVAAMADQSELSSALAAATRLADGPTTIDCYLRSGQSPLDGDIEAKLAAEIARLDVAPQVERITVSGVDQTGSVFHETFRPSPDADGFVADKALRAIHPMIAARLQLARFEHFDLERLASPDTVYAYRATGIDNSRDVRLLAAAEVRDLTPSFDDKGEVAAFPAAEQAIAACADAIRAAQNRFDPRRRLGLNRIVLYVWPPFDHPLSTLQTMADRLSALTIGLGLDGIEVIGELFEGGDTRPALARFGFEADGGRLVLTEPDNSPIAVLDRYRANVVASRQRGSIYPYELVQRLVRDGGSFTEHDLGPTPDDPAKPAQLVPVLRAPGNNSAGFVAGVLTTPSDRHPEGMTTVTLMGDPTKGLASIAEAECRLVIGACDLAEKLGVPLDWYAVSAGARIAMESGTENMDWISRALRRIIEFTQDGGEINVVVTGINVGAQPYWNAEATMLMHTKGILVMTPDSAMVLTGKQSLDYSGGVSAEDNFGLGGYDRIMGPNGQAQYWAPDLDGAIEVLRRHHEQSWVGEGERFPRQAVTADSVDRDVSPSPHVGDEFETVGDVFAESTNPGRKKPFDMASIMRAVADSDHEAMERWADMREAETAIIHEARLNGHPVMMIGISSRAIPRTGIIPADGPDQWTSGTLFPLSSKKIARAINSASGNRPVVVLANLSGFDGSPESLARHQLEFGAEIGRAITNFDGPVVFCVVSRYHGGAFVVFSKVLNDNMEALAVDGTYASVLGGAPAAAVVFAREVDQRTDADPRVAELADRVRSATGSERTDLQARYDELRAEVRAEKLGEKAAEFDAVHTVERARQVGSVDRIIAPERLRPELIASVERGMARAIES